MKKLIIIGVIFIQLFFGVVISLAQKKPDFICIDSLKDLRSHLVTPLYNFDYVPYWAIDFIDSSNGLRILIKGTADQGFIAQHTSDGGNSWKTIYIDTLYEYLDINGKLQTYIPENLFVESHYLSKDSCLIVCNNGLNLFSKDNCQTWEKIKDTINITSYMFLNKQIIVKNLWKTIWTETPQIDNERFTTTDKGKTWEKIEFEEDNLLDLYYQIRLIDSNTIFFPFFNVDSNLVTKPKLYNIREKTWEKLPSTTGFSGNFDTETFSKYDYSRVIERFIDSIRYRYIIRTRDGGYNWDTLFKIQNQRLYRIKYFDSLNVLAWGPTNVLIKSIDGGKNWEFQQVENYSHDQAALDTSWYYLSFYQASWPELNSIYVMASSSFLYKYVGHLNSFTDNKEKNKLIRLYPNPAHKSESLNVILSGLDEKNYTLEVIDLIGRKYYNLDSYFSSVSTLLQIDTRNMNSGTYFLILKNQAKIISMNKFIIQ